MKMNHRTRSRAALALALLVPAPTIGAAAGLIVLPGPVGQAIYGASKLWLLALPLIWLKWVDRGGWSWSPPRRGGFGVAVGLGLAISALIVAGHALAGRHLVDLAQFRTIVERNGVGTVGRYVALSLYLITINSLLEEYVWRWFVFEKWHTVTGGRLAGWLAVLLAAACFTIHHVVALGAQFGVSITIIGSAGVFIGGAA
jgi:hypothetical protein